MKSTIALTLTAMLLSGCVTATIDPRVCPMLKTYTKAELNQMADELEKAGPMLRTAARDYLKLRDQVRACKRK